MEPASGVEPDTWSDLRAPGGPERRRWLQQVASHLGLLSFAGKALAQSEPVSATEPSAPGSGAPNAAAAPATGRVEPADDGPFSLGVASGSPTSDGMVLWTRLMGPQFSRRAGGPEQVHWEIAEDTAFARIVAQGTFSARPELAHAVHIEVRGLRPDREYHYRFQADGARSPQGRTCTLPEADAPMNRLRLAYASCQRWEHGYFSAWRHMLADAPDVVLFLGDYIYEYPGATRAVRQPGAGWVQSLDDYRARYALYRSEPELQAMHAACPWIVTWDDHEVQNDYAGLRAGDSGPPVADFPARRAAAYQAWYEHMPVRSAVLTRALQGLALGAELRVHGQLRFGRLANLYLTDTRQYRDAQVCTPPGRGASGEVKAADCEAWHDPARSLLGAAQEQWLGRAFERGDAVWNILAQQTLLGRRRLGQGEGARYWNDGWDGYPAARQRLLDAMQRSRLANPVVLGGDVHENWVGHVQADYADTNSRAIGTEFCGTSISSRSSGQKRVPQWLADNPHFVFGDSSWRGYGLAEFSPEALRVDLRVVDDVTRRDSGAHTLASFQVRAGQARVEQI